MLSETCCEPDQTAAFLGDQPPWPVVEACKAKYVSLGAKPTTFTFKLYLNLSMSRFMLSVGSRSLVASDSCYHFSEIASSKT